MTTLQEAAQMALDALTYIHTETNQYEDELIDGAITALRAALAQPEQEPVAWTERELELIDGMIEVQVIHAERCESIPNRAMAEKQKGWDMERVELLRKIRTTTPPQRKWVGLTDEEEIECYRDAINHRDFYRAIEAKLKEKNG